MNSGTKKRLVVVTGVIAIVLILILAFVGSSMAAKTLTIAQALSGDYTNQRVQVTGNVVKNSYELTEGVLTFAIYDPNGNPANHLRVVFEGAVSATFGNDVTAICTGKIGEDGVLYASELVTKCPSKYESATDALSVSKLLDYGSAIFDTPVRVTGIVKAGTLRPAGGDYRFVLVDTVTKEEVPVRFSNALPENIVEGAQIVVTGSLESDMSFAATSVALKG